MPQERVPSNEHSETPQNRVSIDQFLSYIDEWHRENAPTNLKKPLEEYVTHRRAVVNNFLMRTLYDYFQDLYETPSYRVGGLERRDISYVAPEFLELVGKSSDSIQLAINIEDWRLIKNQVIGVREIVHVSTRNIGAGGMSALKHATEKSLQSLSEEDHIDNLL